MNRFTAQNVEWFFAALEQVEAVYGDAEFSFLVHSGPLGVSLVHSRLALQPLPSPHPDRVIEAGYFYGFSGRLKSLEVNPKVLIKMLLDGYVPAPDRVWRLSRDNAQYSVVPNINRLGSLAHINHLQQQIYELSGFGLSIAHARSDDDEWSLRSAKTPFSGINDLLRELRLPTDAGQFQAIALPPIVVDLTSRVKGEIAELKLRRSKYLPEQQVSLGIIVNNGGNVVERRKIPGAEFNWAAASESDAVLVGVAEVPVPKASVIHCLATYDRRSYHHYWVADPDASQNPLRTIYQVFDPNFEDAVAMLRQLANKGQSSAQENAVAAPLWVFGFSPLQLGRFSETPDVVAISSDGHFIVVECTLSDPQSKKHNKTQKLLDRTNEIRAALERSNTLGRVCIPVLVTSRKRADHRR